MCSNALNSRGKLAVSPMSGSPTFGTEKKQKRGEFKTPPRPTGRRSNNEKKCYFFYQTLYISIKKKYFEIMKLAMIPHFINRAVARTLIGGVYIHIFRFCLTSFF